MTEVRFRNQYTVWDLLIPENLTYGFDYGGPHQNLVQLRPPTAKEHALGHKQQHAVCTSFLRMPLSTKNQAVFADIAANKILSAESMEGGSYPGPDGARIRIPGLAAFPAPFRSLLDDARRELKEFAKRTVSVLRWRAGLLGPHDPIQSRGFEWSWSFDGEFWHMAPIDTSVTMDVLQRDAISAEVIEQVRQLVSEGTAEPVGHNMLREAAQRPSSDPRTAIVIGLAAAELGVKHCIADLVPDAEWLATHVPSPPLERILRDYLPLLPVRNRFADVVKVGTRLQPRIARAGQAMTGSRCGRPRLTMKPCGEYIADFGTWMPARTLTC